MEGWKDGGMEGWKDGGMEGWKDGGMEAACSAKHRDYRQMLRPYASNLYPTPQTVWINCGAEGSVSIFSRRRRMWTVTVDGSP